MRSFEYSRLQEPESKETEFNETEEIYIQQKKPRLLTIWRVASILSMALNLLFIASWSQRSLKQGSGSANPPSDYAEGVDIPTVYKQFWWNTEYSSMNETQKDELWNAILPSHGFVAVDTAWAAERHYPESMNLPGDDSKAVYLLEAYHQLHCLKILRLTMKEAVNGLPYTWHPGEHIDHCFDTLRQTAMCNADSTPLYTFGKNTAGVGQVHKCRDWEALRTYATENTACYRDSVEDILLGQHFGYCDDGNDGLIEGHPVTVKFD